MADHPVPVPIVQAMGQVDPPSGWVDVWMTGNDGKLYHKWFRPGQGWQGPEVVTGTLQP